MCLFLKPQVVIIQGEQMFVRPEEEHDGAGVVELVHLVEVGHLRDVNQVDHDKVLALLSNGIEGLIHFHASRVPVMTKPSG